MKKKVLVLFGCVLLLVAMVPIVGAANWIQMQKLSHCGPISLDGNTALIGAPGEESVYVFTYSGTAWTQQTVLQALDMTIGDHFGCAVSLSGDTAVIGASSDDDNGVDSGSAYVFVRTGTIWTQQAKLLASDGVAYDAFGSSVAVSGDYALIGALYGFGAWGESGTAYVFVRTTTVWSEQQKLIPGGISDDLYSFSVSLSGDTAVVGAPAHGYSWSKGVTHIFRRSGTTWMEEAALSPSDGAAFWRFGWSVSISGDTVLIGAVQDGEYFTGNGTAYVFTRTGTTWTEQAKLFAADGAPGDYFGDSVAVHNDTAFVGVPHDDDKGTDSGSVYVFIRTGAIWIQGTKLFASDEGPGDYFGGPLSLQGTTAFIGGVDSIYVFTAANNNEHLDQQQTKHTKNFAIYSGRWGGQSLKPTVGMLTSIKIYMKKIGHPSSCVKLSIRSTLSGADLVCLSKPASQIPTSYGWVKFDINDLTVTPGSTYYLVLRTAGGSSSNCYSWGYGYHTSYTKGIRVYSTNSGSSWINNPSYDCCFKTYGI